MRGLLMALALLSTLGALCACEDEAERGGLPACEPAEELVLERGLKEGFRALSAENQRGARAAFQAVLKREPGHPEARAGLRQANLLHQKVPGASAHEGLSVGEHQIQTQQPVDHFTLRLEVRAKELAIAKREGRSALSAPKHIKHRRGEGKASLSDINLLVLHTTGTITALERFVHMQHGEEEAHFLIDYDGSVYQTLDLARIAKHTGSQALDARSVAIELVAPRDSQKTPLPKEAKGLERVLSPRLRVQGKLLRSWGFTAPQMQSLKGLIDDLVRLLPDLEATTPQAGSKVPLKVLSPVAQRTVTGIVGALHVDPESFDPGPGFDWSAIP